MECSVDWCGKPARSRNVPHCSAHYTRLRRHGTLDVYAPGANPSVSYRAAHSRVSRLWGLAASHPCITCGRAADHWSYDKTDPAELECAVSGYTVTYSAWPEFYMPLCLPCHRSKDGRKEACRKGHPLSGSNLYSAPSRPGSRQCKKCARESTKLWKRRARLRKKNLKENE